MPKTDVRLRRHARDVATSLENACRLAQDHHADKVTLYTSDLRKMIDKLRGSLVAATVLPIER